AGLFADADTRGVVRASPPYGEQGGAREEARPCVEAGVARYTTTVLAGCVIRPQPSRQQRTNVWRKVTSPGRGAKATKKCEIRQPSLWSNSNSRFASSWDSQAPPTCQSAFS